MEDSGFEEVILFSGGLDSFGGAVQEILQGQRKVVLVSHRPVSKLYSRQRHLVNDIVGHLSNKALSPLHVAVEVNKSKHFGKEFTQRSRSFLFAGIAGAVAKGLGRNRIRFYENGIISLNLPLSPQAVGGRATRTTHPQVLAGFQEILSLAFGSPFSVENPYFWKTKTDILCEIKAAGHSKMCAHTCSCTHTKQQTNMFTHCGYCSQCVDRRLSALAAEYGNEEDPKEMYSSDVVTGAREKSDFTMVERYLGTCLEIDRLSRADEFVKRFPEVTRALNHVGKPPAQAASDIFDLFKRHARDICHTLERIVSNSSAQVIRKDYPPNCLLGIAVGRNSCAASASSAVAGETPAACPSVRAANDPTLILDDGIFTVFYRGKPCELRNTKEFAILKQLSVATGRYLSTDSLRAAVWGADDVDKNTIQRHMSFLRRRLKESRVTGVSIDGKTNKDHYALILS
jgi:7-cyano-7-deazaguanine synthase in queuosine biosynthesis